MVELGKHFTSLELSVPELVVSLVSFALLRETIPHNNVIRNLSVTITSL
jgi:hypothetical protein